MRVFAVLASLAAASAQQLTAQAKTPPPPPKIITEVSAAVDLPNYQGGPCPAKLTFTGTIVADKMPSVPITYRWVGSDTSKKSPVRTLTMTSRAAIVSDVWEVGTSGEMMRVWNELRIISPNAIKSNRATAAILCR